MNASRDELEREKGELGKELEREREANERLQAENERLGEANERLREEIGRLRKELEAALRAARKQAAPFSKGKPVKKRKRSGRKPGKGTFNRRAAPGAGDAKGPAVQVPVTRTECPGCGGELKFDRTDLASNTDIPASPQAETTVYEIEVRRCDRCGQRVRGSHPDVAPDQQGATAHRVGPRTMAVAHVLHYGIGVPVRQVPKILRELSGITITQGAITQDALKRVKGELGRAYRELRASVSQARAIYTDDTGWRVDGKNAQLMVFDTDGEVVYQIRPQHRNEEVREVVPSNYAGTLVTDRGPSYEAEELSGLAQQKCLSHILRNVADVVKTKSGRAREFGNSLSNLLRKAIALGKRRGKLADATFAAQITRIADPLTLHLRDRKLKDPDNQRLLDGIGAQHDKNRLLRFLHEPGVEPTNNRAERALRPAVIARKVSHCSKNQAGADAFAAFTSVIRTAIKRGTTSVTDTLHQLFVTPNQPP